MREFYNMKFRIYAKTESVNKMLQHGIEKSNFSDRPFSVLCILINLLWAVAHLILMVFHKELYILSL